MKAAGPLTGLRIVEFAGIGPVPFCGMLLSDLGADVLLIDRPGAPAPTAAEVLSRGRQHVSWDLKDPAKVKNCLDFIESADVLLEGFRPGVMEKLGLGPDAALSRNPRLVYARMTGWGQTGPYANMAGHDINYIAITGALHAMGAPERPIPPLNLVGDFGGGALYLAFGVMAALRHASLTGQGQVIDCAISDGAASLMAMFSGYLARNKWTEHRETNQLDGGAPYYRPYQCADGEWIAIGCIEKKFFDELMQRFDLPASEIGNHHDPANWDRIHGLIREKIAAQPSAYWSEKLVGTDVCFAPVLPLSRAHEHPHNQARETFVSVEGVMQPAPAPRFSCTPGAIQRGASGDAVESETLARWRRGG